MVHRFALKLRDYERDVDTFQAESLSEVSNFVPLQEESMIQSRMRTVLPPRERVSPANEEAMEHLISDNEF